MLLYVHFNDTVYPIQVQEHHTLEYLSILTAGLSGVGQVFFSRIPQQLLHSGREISSKIYCSTFFNDLDDVFVVRQEKLKDLVPHITNEVKQVQQNFHSLQSYSFYESGKMGVRVQVPLEGIHNHPKDQITCTFAPKSFSFQIFNFNGRNYQFTVPRLQCRIDYEKCGYRLNTDRIVIMLRKVKESDNWFSLFKAKTVGGGDDSD